MEFPLDAKHKDVSVLYRVAADEDTVLHIKDGNTSRRVPRKPDDFKFTIPEVELVPMFYGNNRAKPVLAVVLI